MNVIETRDDADDFGTGTPVTRTTDEVIAYLEADPHHAVVFPDTRRYVLRGAGEGLDDFFAGPMPAEDPNDADGPMSANDAIADAVAG